MLDMAFLDVSHIDIPFNDGIIHYLVTVPFRQLKRLHIAGIDLNHDAMEALSTWDSLKTVTFLSLYETKQNSKTLFTLLNSPVVSNLRYLDLDENDATKTMLKAIARSKYLKNLHILELSDIEVENEDIVHILKHTNLPNLKYILFEFMDISEIQKAHPEFKYELPMDLKVKTHSF